VKRTDTGRTAIDLDPPNLDPQASGPDADHGVHRPNGACTLADGRSDTLHRTMPYVADGKDAGHARLEGERSASEGRVELAEKRTWTEAQERLLGRVRVAG